ncbi:hypothetical protein MMC10_001978 [Thelotrema lepadinum]|nr:hypothetical protein [Thelotrema lepadinum]
MAAHPEEPLTKEVKIIVESSPPLTPTSPAHHSLDLTTATTKEAHLYDSNELSNPNSEDFHPVSTNPFSAFYSHPQTRTSLEQLRQCSTNNLRCSYPQPPAPAYGTHLSTPNASNIDLEHGEKLPFAYSRPSFDPSMAPSSLGPRKACTVWPGKEHFESKRKEMKRTRGCWPLNTLGKKQRRWAQALFVLLIIGIATGVGVGVSIKTGGGVYRGNGVQEPIGN